MRRCIVLLILAVCILAGSVYGFDGNRKGFVLGGGLGVCAQSKWSFDSTELYYSLSSGRLYKADEKGAGPAANFVIGYAWNEQNMIVYEGNIAIFKSEVFLDNQGSQGFNGVSWYHYFGAPGKAFFTAVGLGGYVWKVEQVESNDPGFGFLLGGGFEFVKHVQAGIYFSAGKTSKHKVDFDHSHVSIIVSAIAF